MKVTREHPPQSNAVISTVHKPAETGFSPSVIDAASHKLGLVAARANEAAKVVADGGALDPADHLVTKPEIVHYAANFAADDSKGASEELLKLYQPEHKDVTLPEAFAPVRREVWAKFPGGYAEYRDMPQEHRAAAHKLYELFDFDGERVSTVPPSYEFSVKQIDKALAKPEHVETLRALTGDYEHTPPAIVGQLEALKQYLNTAGESRDLVPSESKTPVYAKKLPVAHAHVELVTFGSLENVGNAGSRAQFNWVNRYLQVKADEGTSVILRAESAGQRGDVLVGEQTVKDREGMVDVIKFPGIRAGEPTRLTVAVVKGGKIIECVEIDIPANPIKEKVTIVHAD